MKRKLIVTVVASAAFLYSCAVRADVISEQLSQAGGAATFALGQSLTTPAGGPWNNVTFNWFDTGGTPNAGVPTPIAAGTLFLVNQQYSGTPAALSASTIGYIAQSQSIAGGMYVFSASLVIQPNTTYYFLSNQTVPNNSGNLNTIPGTAYADTGPGGVYAPVDGDARFRLQGSVVPEPGAAALCILAFFITPVIARRRDSAVA